MNVLICSRHFSPAFIGHMKAWYKLCEECGYSALLYFSADYIRFFCGEGYKYTIHLADVETFCPKYVVVQNIGFEDVELFKWCKKQKCRLLYLLHEPYMGLTEILKEGNKAPKHMVGSMLNHRLCQMADRVIVCSEYAKKNCEKYMKSTVKKLDYIPLLFLDDYDEYDSIERQYFSMIGTYAFSHGSDVFLNFIKEAYKQGFPLKYQIATRSNVYEQLKDPVFKKMENDGALLIQQGRPLTEKEMCDAYRRSYVVWNGYRRSTQSGVLPNAFMQGTPVIATRLPSFHEYVVPGETGSFINSMDFSEIYNALKEIKEQGNKLNAGCRKFFLENFYYRAHVKTLKSIINAAV